MTKKRRRATKKAVTRQERTQTTRERRNQVLAATSAIPDCWFLDPLRAEMRICVRPPTQRTRRRLVEVKNGALPRSCFKSFMAPLKDGDAAGLERDEEGNLKPTRQSATLTRHEYTVVRPMVTDQLFQLEQADLKKGPHKATRKKGGEWDVRDLCSRTECIVRLASKLSMVAGHFRIKRCFGNNHNAIWES
eukprot:6207891-Pleurochrysis_carterae.AAC.3